MLYHIARSGVEQQMKNQFQEAPEPNRPERPEPERTRVHVAVRLRLSEMLHTLANAVEPASHVCEPATSQQA